MSMTQEKIDRLMKAASLYYEQDQTQSEIAKIFGVSRPMVSKMLREAKDLGMVKIQIAPPMLGNSHLIEQARKQYHVQGGLCLPKQNNDNATNEALAKGTIAYLGRLGGKRLGIGWGTFMGKMAEILEQKSSGEIRMQSVCPLIGNSGVSTRNYHSNELVRIFAQNMGAIPAYLYAPAFIATEQEYHMILEMESYQEIYGKWDRLEVALVNIGNYPSVPDYASGVRFGSLLQERKAVGRVLTYFYNIEGEILQGETDYTIKMPLEKLAQVKYVIGVCSANTSPQALVGALRTGLIGHIVAPQEVLERALEL